MAGKKLVRVALAGVLLLEGRVVADDYYVTRQGDDVRGDGSRARPWLTLTHALRTIPVPGPGRTHTLHVGPGTWAPGGAERFPLAVPQGIRVRGSGVGLTVVTGRKVAGRRPPLVLGAVPFRLAVPPGGFRPGLAMPEIRDLTLADGRHGVEVVGSAGGVPSPSLRGLAFVRNQIGLVVTNGAPSVIGCRFEGNGTGAQIGRTDKRGGPITLAGSLFLRNQTGLTLSNARYATVEKNRFEANGTGVIAAAISPIVLRPTFRNNVYFRNGQGWSGYAALAGRIEPTLVHETFYANATGIASMDDPQFGGRSDPAIVNTIVWGSRDWDLVGVSREEIRHSDIRTATGAPVAPIIGRNGMLALDPRFSDPRRGVLTLLDTSPLIDRGDPDAPGMPATDLEGEPRATGFPDLGADEVNTFLAHALAGSRSRELRLALTARNDPGLPYVLAASAATDPAHPIPIDRRRIPLSPDPLFFRTFGDPRAGFQGLLGGGGMALLRMTVPDLPRLRGLTVHLGYVTLDPGWPSGIKTVSNVVSVDLGRL